jgi:GntR family transcriptional regulator
MLANFFEIKTDRKVLKMERVRGTSDEPFVYFISYFHPRIGLTGDEDFKRPLYELLEIDYSTVATLSKEEISAHAADDVIASRIKAKKWRPGTVPQAICVRPGRTPH